jgi:hypothetical protein
MLIVENLELPLVANYIQQIQQQNIPQVHITVQAANKKI